MKNYTICIQNGLREVELRLLEEGHIIVPYNQAGLNSDIVIISGVESAYEEIETAQPRRALNDKEVFLINASGLTPDAVVDFINHK
jgi:hypothetical protein